jgi:hypothetical protein
VDADDDPMTDDSMPAPRTGGGWDEGPPMALTELSLGAEGTLSVFRAFFQRLLGDDWDARLEAAGAAPGEGASDEDIVVARYRAVEFVKSARPDLAWTDDLQDMVDQAWWTLSTHAE